MWVEHQVFTHGAKIVIIGITMKTTYCVTESEESYVRLRNPEVNMIFIEI